MCQVFGLARARGARKPGTFAPSFPAPSEWQDQMCWNVGNPEIGPDPNQKRLFTKRIYHSKSGPGFSIFARSLLLPTPNERRDQIWAHPDPRGPKTWHICSFLPCTIGIYEKNLITQNLALVFQFLPAPFSSLHPMNGETKCARFLGSPGPAEPENLAHFLLHSLHHSNGKATCAGMEGTPRSAPTPIKNAIFTKRIYHSKSGPPFSSLHPMNGETKYARFLGSPGPAEPENLAHLLLHSLHHSNGKATCAGMEGTPRLALTPIKNALFTKRIYHSKSGPEFSIFARSVLLPTPNERRDQMCQGFWAHPAPRGPKTWHICSFLPCTIGTARPNVPECGEHRDQPRPQSKTPFLRKEFITQNLALVFQFLPAPFSSLHPMNGETKCARFLGSPGPAEPENLAHLLLHHSNGKGHMCRNGGGELRDRPRSQSKTPFHEKNLSLKS